MVLRQALFFLIILNGCQTNSTWKNLETQSEVEKSPIENKESGSKEPIVQLTKDDSESGQKETAVEMDMAATLHKKKVTLDDSSQVEMENTDLKQARIWARLDQLEGTLANQKERIAVLEQAMLLGINPQREHISETSHPAKEMLGDKEKFSVKISEIEEQSSAKANLAAEEANMVANYGKRLVLAKDLFNQGKFGPAYLEFSKLDKEFAENITHGEPRFYIGQCWYGLKEYENAKQYFLSFIDKFTQSPYFALAKFHLAKTQYAMGMRQQALMTLKNLIKDHPYEASSEAARQMIKNISKTF